MINFYSIKPHSVETLKKVIKSIDENIEKIKNYDFIKIDIKADGYSYTLEKTADRIAVCLYD